MYLISPDMSFSQVVDYYEKYLKEMKDAGKEPVKFINFITGRY